MKFHVDDVQGLGSFVEIEAIDVDGNIGHTRLAQQCRRYLDMLEIAEQDLVTHSYSDLLQQSS